MMKPANFSPTRRNFGGIPMPTKLLCRRQSVMQRQPAKRELPVKRISKKEESKTSAYFHDVLNLTLPRTKPDTQAA
jgi:hypothetical protein